MELAMKQPEIRFENISRVSGMETIEKVRAISKLALKSSKKKEEVMKRIIMYLAVFCIVAFVVDQLLHSRRAREVVAQGLVDTITKGCDKELKEYCRSVTPGEGRVLACLYAFNDKLSGTASTRSMMLPRSSSGQ